MTRFVHTNRLFKLFNTILVKFLQSRGYNKMKVQDNVDLLSLFIFMVFSTHLLACVWCYLGLMDKYLPPHQRKSWVFHQSDEGVQDFDENQSKAIYIFAVYWILETLTTVGYGDYVGHTREEYIFSMVLEVS
jgi:hypothetical protein